MKLNEQLSKLKQTPEWDVIVIGGASGLELHLMPPGYKTILVEAVDFAKGTSSRSTKLVHGGVRYLEKVTSLLLERLLKKEA
jgi:glycerol-3-phosphate dehydrogenase